MVERDQAAALPQDGAAQAPAPVLALEGHCVIGVGASAGGLETCRLFLAGLPANPPITLIIVQHLDPTHESLMAELLTSYTTMPVVQAQDRMVVELGRIYVIPPGVLLALAHGRLRLSEPLARHGIRLPFDFLLQSIAATYGASAACVILSGCGTDGTIGAQTIKSVGGLVIAQEPKEAIHSGMPESAIATGAVDLVLPAADIGAALVKFASDLGSKITFGTAEIIALLKAMTPHDFTLYKTGTLDRRIARRMSLAGLDPGASTLYLERLRHDEAERLKLADDLLINVTSFFRDPTIFEMLANSTIPDMVENAQDTVRLWVAGCSTGEETYSLAMLLLEQIASQKPHLKLQIFATDIDAQAVMVAREGVYPASIEHDVSAKRLARFFVHDGPGYRVSPVLRGCVVFAVQDILSDPPFSKLNMVSCRNLLIYLRPEAQARIIAVFNFALRPGGFLLLGTAETISATDQRFQQVSREARLYCKLGNTGADHLPSGTSGADFIQLRLKSPAARAKPDDVGEICRKLVLERYAPAAVMVNARLECLYRFGPIAQFLRTPSGPVTHDLLAQLPPSLRSRMRDAVMQVAATQSVIRFSGGRIVQDGQTRTFDVEIQPVPDDPDKFLACFLNQQTFEPPALSSLPSTETNRSARITELETELTATKAELEQAVRGLESAAEEHNAMNEEALSVNEEYQSTNEELLTSKEELQSLNEELTALNGQLQEALERSRMTSTDLRNVLYSTDVPTLFLDTKLNIRFFTPSATLLFHIIPSDIGRKLEDFRSLAADPSLLTDASDVLETAGYAISEIETATGIWYERRLQPYRTHEGAVAGVVLTFTDITDRKRADRALQAARQESERANLAKSRFLAAASHDLRQPLQTMSLINGMLAKTVTDPASKTLVGKLDNTMHSITMMLNAMLDINQIEAGIVRTDIVNIKLSEVLTPLYERFKDSAAAQGTDLRIVPCGLSITTDPALLDQMLTNLVANALKFTVSGRVLIGCRRQAETARIEVWDTGIGIAANQLQYIFDEYHQIDNAARLQSRGLGLGLSIVQRLGRLLGHKIAVRSVPSMGSVFSIEIPLAAGPTISAKLKTPRPAPAPSHAHVLIIEDDPDISQLLKQFLTDEGLIVALAQDGTTATALVRDGIIDPDLILADYNLTNSATGLEIAKELRVHLNRKVPVIIITGDISSQTLRLIANQDCLQINKPMKMASLLEAIQRLLDVPKEIGATARPTIHVIDDDLNIRTEMSSVFKTADMNVVTYPDAEQFITVIATLSNDDCLLVDAGLPGLSGLQLLEKLRAEDIKVPAIIITGRGDIPMAVQAMKAGAADFLEKPVSAHDLLACVRRVLTQNFSQKATDDRRQDAAKQIAGLTARQREIMTRVLAGQPSKNIAADLGISQRTVENHRATIMLKTGAKSIPALVRLAVSAEVS